MIETWQTTVTAFALTRRDSSWLMILHERLGVTSWELPGGHAGPGETLEMAAARETFEETGVAVEVGRLIATCVHEWHERRQRKIICFFEAAAIGDGTPSLSPDEPHVLEVAWADPLAVEPVSPFLNPLVAQQRMGWPDIPISFHMTHHRNADGLWEPVRLG
jgi:8-oxo-dGTP diphosphatase